MLLVKIVEECRVRHVGLILKHACYLLQQVPKQHNAHSQKSSYDVDLCCSGIGDDELHLNADLIASIFQCTITTWNDIAIKSLNPSLPYVPPR
jgi:hypothetical protein